AAAPVASATSKTVVDRQQSTRLMRRLSPITTCSFYWVGGGMDGCRVTRIANSWCRLYAWLLTREANIWGMSGLDERRDGSYLATTRHRGSAMDVDRRDRRFYREEDHNEARQLDSRNACDARARGGVLRAGWEVTPRLSQVERPWACRRRARPREAHRPRRASSVPDRRSCGQRAATVDGVAVRSLRDGRPEHLDRGPASGPRGAGHVLMGPGALPVRSPGLLHLGARGLPEPDHSGRHHGDGHVAGFAHARV